MINLSFDTGALLAVLLVSIRVAVLFFATPMDALSQLPVHIRLFLVLTLSVVLTQLLDIKPVTGVVDAVTLAVAAINELVLGTLMAFGLHAAFASFMVAGKLIDFQSGFGSAEILNPAAGTSSPMTGMVLSLMAMLFFFLSNAHHLLLKGIAWSLVKVPPGQPLTSLNVDAVIQQFGAMFMYGLVIAAPIVGVLLLLDTTTAVMGKSMPQMNVYFLFLPLKIGVALVMSALAVRFMSPVIEKVFLISFTYMQKVVL